MIYIATEANLDINLFSTDDDEVPPLPPQLLLRYLLSNQVRKYTKSHEWIEYFPERKVARVGISNYAQQQLGEIIHVEFPSVGKSL